ncbi:uncharacterized protein LOC115973891 [Quercus lobata]|uniref:uncharacterized protein LOC115973891 n=1 Tax=Quercus lobata TaxID=97700 RepID=UPI0012461554|nr:uncharacterized protein LOC115973891 [Quercus lobata]
MEVGTDFLHPGRKAVKPDEMASTFSCVKEVGVNATLVLLRASEAASLSPSLTATGNRLNGIQDLHDCVSKLLQLSFTQQALAQEQHKTWFDELLHESLRLLDLCGIAKDSLLQTKECTHQLQSIMRRRRGRSNGAYKGD